MWNAWFLDDQAEIRHHLFSNKPCPIQSSDLCMDKTKNTTSSWEITTAVTIQSENVHQDPNAHSKQLMEKMCFQGFNACAQNPADTVHCDEVPISITFQCLQVDFYTVLK